MQESYKTPTVAQDLKVVDCIAEDLKPLFKKVSSDVMEINRRLEKKGIVSKRIYPPQEQQSYQYKPV